MNDSEKDLQNTEVEDVAVTPDADPVTESPIDEAPKPDKPKKSKGDTVRRIIQIVAGVVAIGCIAFLVYKYVSSKKEDNANNEIKNEAVNEDASEADVTIVDDGGETTEKTFTLDDIDFDKLEEEAGDALVGWITVPSVGISYPVCQAEDNDYYMQHNYAGDFAWSGAIYLDYKNDRNMADLRSIVYGHHMTNGSMFAGLLEYDSEDFFKEQQEKDNNYFFIYLKDTVYVYQIFSTCDVTFADNSDTFVIIHSGTDNLKTLLASLKELELYDTGISVSETDTIVTLYTCQNDAASGIRHMVHGKLVATIPYGDAE